MVISGSRISLLFLFLPSLALAGPPFLTDDPEPVDYQHWEINNYFAGGHVSGETSGAAPGFDINYGAAPNLQLHINLAMAYDRMNGGALYYGTDDTELGAKYRFLDPGKDDWWPQAAIYPLFEIPTGADAQKGLGATGEAREFFPLWLQKDSGDWTTYGGGGWWHNPGLENRDYWFFGWVLQRKITDRLTLGGELFYQTTESVIVTPTRAPTSGFNLGGTYDFSDTYHLLFSAGKGIESAQTNDTLTYYFALQLTF
jgi:hypothetical protein